VLTPEEIQKNSLIRIQVSETSSDPIPEDGDSDILRDSVLNWMPGETAATRHIYIGADFDEVDSATVPTASDLDVTSFDPGRLEFGQTYYWRVDEVNGTPDKTVFKGEVWSFTVEPYSIQIPGAEIMVTASSSSSDFSLPEKLVDGSGLGADGSHDIIPETMWFTATGDLDPWFQFKFDDIKQLDTMTVWNSNGAAESAIGWGVKDVVVEYSQDGENWTVLEGVTQFSRAPGLVTYATPDEIAFGGVPAKMVRLDIGSNWGSLLMSYGLSEVQFNAIPAQARTPEPASGSTGVAPDAVVTWRPGREAGEHRIYIGTDANAVADGTALSVTTATNSLALDSLDAQLGEAYYWRVDEVNDAEETTVWAGPVWNLGVIGALVVEDFEAYGNLSPDRPFQTWLDGIGYSADEFFPVPYGGNGTGATIGHDIWTLNSPHYDGDLMETRGTIFASAQAMPFYFDGASQTDRQFAPAQDWTLAGITTLSIAVRGSLDLTAANTLYAKINGQKVTYDGDLSVPAYRPWHIDLTTLGDVSNVTTMTLGVEGTGSGMVLIDDILLHKTAPVIPGPPAGGDQSMVGHWKLDETEGLAAADSSGNENHGTLVGMDGTEWVAGIMGGALMLNGSGQYVDFGNDTSLQLTEELTISTWVKMEPDNADAYMGIGGKLSGNNGYALVRHGSNVFRMWVTNVEGDGLSAINSDVTYTDTEWHHLVGVVSDNTGSLYVDGTKQVSEAPAMVVDTGDIAYIGLQYGDWLDRFWKGAVDDVKIFYRGLSEEEISGL
jgi:hypothetical protein